MKLIDRLLSKVQPHAERLSMAFIKVSEETGFYIADCRLWDGVAKSGGHSIITEHETEQGAREAIDHIAQQYPNKEAVLIFDDLDLE